MCSGHTVRTATLWNPVDAILFVGQYMGILVITSCDKEVIRVCINIQSIGTNQDLICTE